MRVIKQENEKEITCKYCKSILAYTKNDIEYKSKSSVKFIPNGRYIKCIVCKYDNDIE